MGQRIRTVHRKTAHRYGPGGGLHYITFSCYHRLPLLGTALLRDRFVGALRTARERHGFLLVAWVVMPEHVHVILQPTAWLDAGSDLPAILNGLKSSFAIECLSRWRSRGWPGLAQITDGGGRARFWQSGGGFDRNVRDWDELVKEVRYIHQNPVKRGLVAAATDWPWSSARWYAGERVPGDPPIHDRVMCDGCEFPGPEPWHFLE